MWNTNKRDMEPQKRHATPKRGMKHLKETYNVTERNTLSKESCNAKEKDTAPPKSDTQC